MQIYFERKKRLALFLFLLIAGGRLPASAMNEQGDMSVSHQRGAMGMGHSAHLAMMNTEAYEREICTYQVPEVGLVDQRGNPVSLQKALDAAGPLLLNFIYATCTTICPVLSAGFNQMQGKANEAEMKGLRMISITIDPDHDTPDVLAQYARRFHAGNNWTFLTGARDVVIDVLKAFDVYRRDKMNHIPVTLLRTRGDATWVRLEGLPSTSDLLKEFQILNN